MWLGLDKAMTRDRLLAGFTVVASLSLAIAVYCFARSVPPEVLSTWTATNNELASYTAIFGSAPSFFYTLAIGLLLGACAAGEDRARLHCLAWTGLSLLLELSQHSLFAGAISDLGAEMIPGSAWAVVGPYWSRGIFDPLDVLATLAGCLVALTIISRLAGRTTRAVR